MCLDPLDTAVLESYDTIRHRGDRTVMGNQQDRRRLPPVEISQNL